jgi:hypothetical protein
VHNGLTCAFGRHASFLLRLPRGSSLHTDDEGLEYPDLDAAEHAAATAAAEIGRDLLPNPEFRDVTIEVRNEYGQRVCTVTVTMHMERVHPSPEPPAA